MSAYMGGVFLINFFVSFLLLLAATRLCGYPIQYVRSALGAVFMSLHATCCLLPGFSFLGNLLWRVVSLAVGSVIAYDFTKSAFRVGVIFAFLSMALEGTVMGMEQGGIIGILCTAAVLCLLCFFGFRGRVGGICYVPVELSYGDKRLRITALQDTGNTLRDPITGRDVLVIGADVAWELTGLTPQQLQKPIESVGLLPGLRLIPYHSIGANSFLLAMRLKDVKIGKWQGSTLVAFAPEGLSTEGTYQALTGGIV